MPNIPEQTTIHFNTVDILHALTSGEVREMFPFWLNAWLPASAENSQLSTVVDAAPLGRKDEDTVVDLEETLVGPLLFPGAACPPLEWQSRIAHHIGEALHLLESIARDAA